MNKKRLPEDQENVERVMRAREVGREEARMEIDAANRKTEAAKSVFEAAGKIKGCHFFKSQAEFFSLIFLKQVKDSRDYYEKYGMTWEQFCEYCGLKRRTVDEHLQDLKPFRDEWLADFRHFLDSDIHKIKYLGMAVTGGAAEIQDDGILFAGEKIPLTKADIASFLDRLEITYKDRIDDQRKQAEKEKNALNEQISEANKDITVFKNEVERLRAFEPKGADEDITGKLNAVEGHLAQVDNLMRSFVFTTSDLSDETFGRVAGICERIRNRWEMFQTEFYELKEVQ